MDISYIALTDFNDPTRMLVIQTVPLNATTEQRQIALAITSILTALLYRLGHYGVGVALLAENQGKIFRFESIAAQCRTTLGCARIPEAQRSSISVRFAAIYREALRRWF